MKILACLITAVFLSLMLAAGSPAQSVDDALLSRYIEVKGRFKAGSWEAAHFLADQGIPVGYEAAENSNIDSDPRVVLKSGTLEEILDSISRQDEFCTWEIVDGVVNFFPVMDRSKKISGLLDTKIDSITVLPGDNRASAVAKVKALYDGGNGNGVYFHSYVEKENYLGMPDKFKDRVDIPASDLRTVLNKLAKAQPWTPLWTVRLSEDRKTVLVAF